MALSQGVRLGHYEIVAPLGAGGMGAVYKATDTRLGRTVAIKVLPDHAAADPQRRLRFEQEARAVSALNHPNICVLYDVGRETPSGGRGAEDRSGAYTAPVEFLVMEHLEGETLSKRLRDGGVSFDEALDIGAQVADALAKAHRHGVIHRDLKPGNVMLTKTGARIHAKLLDFGLAKLRPVLPSDVESTHPRNEPATRPGAVLGTVPYMSPEQLEGKPTDGRTDIFALGCVLYEMVTGRRAFGGDSEASIISAIMAKEPASVASYLPAAPLALDHLIVRCLQKDPEERAESAHDISEELRWIRQTHGGGPASGASPHRRATDSASSNSQSLPSLPSPGLGRRWRRALIAIGLPLIAVGLYASVAHEREWWPWSSDPFRNATLVPLTSESTAQTDPAVSPDGQQVAYVSNAGGVTRIWLVESDASARHPLTDGRALDEDPAWSRPDGRSVYFTRRQGLGASIWRVPRIAGESKRIVENAAEPAVSPDGGRLAFVRDISSGGRVFVAPLNDPVNAKQVTHDEDGKWDHGHPSWSPDGQWLCYHAQDQLWIVRPDGREARPITFDNESAIDPVWSADGRAIYYWSNRDGATALWKVAASGKAKPERLSLSGAGITREPSLSTSGNALAYSSGVGNLDIMVRNETGERALPNTSMHLDMMPRYAPEPISVVFVSDREDNRMELWVQPLEPPNATPWRLTTHPGGEANHPAVSQDGRWVAYYEVLNGQRDIWVVQLKQGGIAHPITSNPADDIQPAWSPDGTHLAFASKRGGVFQIWTVKVANGQAPREELQITHGQGVKQAPEWSPDGKWIAYVILPADRESESTTSDGTPDDLGIWLVQADGNGEPKRIRNSEGALRVRWLENDRMIASGQWGEYMVSLRSLNPWTGERTALRFPVVFGYDPAACDFDFDVKRQAAVFAVQNGPLNIYLANRR